MSNTDTRGSVILGVCQQDPERWREFDSIYRPMLLAFLRKQGLDDSDANDVVQDIFVKLLQQDPDLRPDKMQVPDLALQRGAQHADRQGPAPGQLPEGRGRMGRQRPAGHPLGQREDGRRLGQDPPHEDPQARAGNGAQPNLAPGLGLFRAAALAGSPRRRDRQRSWIIEANAVYRERLPRLEASPAVCQEFDEDLTRCLRL